MKNRSIFAVLPLVFVIFGLFAACDDATKSGSTPQEYTVSFEVNGGSPVLEPQTVTQGDTITQPSAMTRIGYHFGGWYREAAYTNLWDFEADTVSGNITLYAKWVLPIVVSGNTLAEKFQWLFANVTGNSSYILEVVATEEELNSQVLSFTGKSNITIQLKGTGNEKIIALLGNGSLFSIRGGVTLTLDGSLTLVGKNNNNNSPLVYVFSDGKLIMNQGVKITGNTASDSYLFTGGGVCVRGGTFTMNGGEISGNTASSNRNSYGGGVYVDDNGTFTMSGGEISGNTAYSCGGVYVGNGTFTMSGGEISGNIAGGYGGGVCVRGGTFTMSGGKISGNRSSGFYPSSYNDGGGVCVNNGTFTMNGGEISGNTATGGGVYVGNGTFTKSGGTITGYDVVNGNVVKNSSGVEERNRGHAVYVDVYFFDDPSTQKRRESTAGPEVNMDSRVSGVAGGWEN